MAARVKRVPGWAAFLMGVLVAVAVMAVSFLLSQEWRAPSAGLALDVRLPSAPPIPEIPSLPPPPIPTPK